MKIKGVSDVNLNLFGILHGINHKMSEAAKLGIKFMSEQVIKLSDNAAERIKTNHVFSRQNYYWCKSRS